MARNPTPDSGTVRPRGGAHFHGVIHRVPHLEVTDEGEDQYPTAQQGDDRMRWNLGDGSRRVLPKRKWWS